jgi:hypothetical protein
VKSKTPKPDNPAQSRKFIEAARALEAAGQLDPIDASEKFESAMRTIAKPKSKDST